MSELLAAGVNVKSAWDLVNTTNSAWELVSASNPAAVPILLEHLRRPYPERVREGIVRALAVPEAHCGWPVLFDAFRQEKDMSVKWALACALGAAGTEEELEDVIQLLRDQSLGRNRVPLLQVLARSRDVAARAVLEALQTDLSIAKDVGKALRLQASTRAKRGRALRPTTREEVSALSEVSMNFDVDLVGSFLDRLSQMVNGFGQVQLDQVVRLVEALAVNEERELEFEVLHEGNAAPLRIKVVKDDVDAPDLYFFSTLRLAAEIDRLMKAFCEEHGV